MLEGKIAGAVAANYAGGRVAPWKSSGRRKLIYFLISAVCLALIVALLLPKNRVPKPAGQLETSSEKRRRPSELTVNTARRRSTMRFRVEALPSYDQKTAWSERLGEYDSVEEARRVGAAYVQKNRRSVRVDWFTPGKEAKTLNEVGRYSGLMLWLSPEPNQHLNHAATEFSGVWENWHQTPADALSSQEQSNEAAKTRWIKWIFGVVLIIAGGWLSEMNTEYVRDKGGTATFITPDGQRIETFVPPENIPIKKSDSIHVLANVLVWGGLAVLALSFIIEVNDRRL
jgi:hypothetical protein